MFFSNVSWAARWLLGAPSASIAVYEMPLAVLAISGGTVWIGSTAFFGSRACCFTPFHSFPRAQSDSYFPQTTASDLKTNRRKIRGLRSYFHTFSQFATENRLTSTPIAYDEL